MILFDVNVLIHAHREDQEHHAFYRDSIESLVNSSESIGLSTLVAAGFVGVVTHARFPNGPTPLPQAMAVIDGLAAHPSCHWVGPGQRHWEVMSRLCRQSGCTGKRVADAQHAAVAIEHGCRWVTRDRDFVAFASQGLHLELLKPES